MAFIDNFSENKDENYQPVYFQNSVPIFQNKVYPTQAEATEAELGRVELVQSPVSGFIFNKTFAPHKMNYDIHYQNEQSNSSVFKSHLKSVLSLLQSFQLENKKVVEVGCGKGIFFEMMLKEKIDCWGFDPTYEGDNERIKKIYFDESQKGVNADVIIMRHTLEHIPNPFSFIHTIAKANNNKGFLFVEVPTFDWIVNKSAFWDIFYEHCNYFTEDSLGAMFNDPVTGNYFGGQYIYLWADLSKLRDTIPANSLKKAYNSLNFESQLKKYEAIIASNQSLAIWGAGAKGSTFLNILDKDRGAVKYVIDINPAKQNKFIAGTGHPIYNPEILKNNPVENILVMNENYINEIKNQINQLNLTVTILSL